ncbi:MAG TPA: DNA methyltransferase [Azonexus sp.]|nr:DNA methyltransferase [Azonexus sp.]
MYAHDSFAQTTLLAQFISKWHDNGASERAGAHHFFLDLCDLLDVDRPGYDPDNYCFERGASRTGAKRGWADVWKRGCFAWENKRPGKNLDEALRQLMTYALALDNPPLLVVSDREIIRIHTHFTGTPSETHTIRLQDIGAPENLQKLRWVFDNPGKFRPRLTLHDITAEAAGRFAEIAQTLASEGHAPQKVAHFLIQCLFCMFAEDVGLLPGQQFQHIVAKSQSNPNRLTAHLSDLFASMRIGGEFWGEDIPWFNGGLFETIEVIPLGSSQIAALLDAARMDWSQIEPSIFGTLFERGLDPALRAQLGANYTDPDTIRKIIHPVITEPLAEEWEEIKRQIRAKLTAAGKDLALEKVTADARINRSIKSEGNDAESGHPSFRELQPKLAKQVEAQKARLTKAAKAAKKLFLGFICRLRDFRVLDAACGSGNFLYLALRALKDLEHLANLEAEALGLHRQLIIETCPANVMGIEINPYAAELARVTIWIGEIQWMLAHGYEIRRNPILAKLDHIECRDAVLAPNWTEPEWPTANVIVGNPPFIGDKKMRNVLGTEYTIALRKLYQGRVPGGADYVTYWFEKARAKIETGNTHSAGLVATNSIRGGANRKVLERIVATTQLFEAWSDESWINEGAAVRVSLICFGNSHRSKLDGQSVDGIFADLTADHIGKSTAASDLTQARPLIENANVAFSGIQKTGPFEVSGELARYWLSLPNPHGRSNTEIVKPWHNGLDVARRHRDMWIIDFGTDMLQDEAALFEAPYSYAYEHVRPTRIGKREARTNEMWWIYQWPRPVMRATINGLSRFIVTPEVSKHRIFSWLPVSVVPDKNLIVIARADDVTFGILQSRFHRIWALRLGTSLEDRPRYTSSTAFETYPFPAGMTPADTISRRPHGSVADAIAATARRLNQARENWLNPAEWTERLPEVAPGFPDRVIARPGHEVDLKKRTLTNLYNQRPAWLEKAHQQLDSAVAAAYGWTDYTPAIPDEEILRRLLDLNQQRSKAKR